MENCPLQILLILFNIISAVIGTGQKLLYKLSLFHYFPTVQIFVTSHVKYLISEIKVRSCKSTVLSTLSHIKVHSALTAQHVKSMLSL